MSCSLSWYCNLHYSQPWCGRAVHLAGKAQEPNWKVPLASTVSWCMFDSWLSRQSFLPSTSFPLALLTYQVLNKLNLKRRLPCENYTGFETVWKVLKILHSNTVFNIWEEAVFENNMLNIFSIFLLLEYSSNRPFHVSQLLRWCPQAPDGILVQQWYETLPHVLFSIVYKFVTRVLFRTKHKRFFSEPNTNSSFQNQTQTAPQASTKPEKLFKTELNYRIQGNLFACHWIRIASILICLVLQSVPTHVNEVDQSGPEFCSCLKLNSRYKKWI